MRSNIDQFIIAQRGKENLPCPTLILFGMNKLTGRLSWPTSTLSLRPTQKRFLLRDKRAQSSYAGAGASQRPDDLARAATDANHP